MRFHIQHESLYRYSARVVFAPHVLRLNPRPENARTVSRVLTVTPRPAVFLDLDDAYGNRLTRVTFDGLASDSLRIESRLEVETFAPLDVKDDGTAMALPWSAGHGSSSDGLDPYRQDAETDASVRHFAQTIAADAGGRPIAFLERLNGALHSMMDRHIRHEGAAQPAAFTLATRRGACRDITVLFLAACRSQGMAARFVSGYQAQAQTPDGQRYLHAWAQAFVPGSGWSSWDPTHGVKVTDGHVALSAAPDQAATMPIEGGFYGDAQTSTLDWSVRIATD
jgi:transglutaminase-like putative cysteine protease